MSAQLRLAETPAGGLEDATFRIERRGCPRYPAKGAATGMTTDAEGRTSIFGVALVDSSASGLRVVTDKAADVGQVLRVHFDGQPTPGRQGRVVRCREMRPGDGLPAFDIAIECKARGRVA